jgi:exonuclease VII small subunit
MKSIQNQYIDLKEGRMSQQNFMRNLRMTMPQYVTNVTSFNDAVKILKNKAILTEALNENSLLDEVTSEMEDGNSYAESIAKIAAKYNIDEDKLATMVPEESVGDKAYADNYDEPVDDSDVDWANENEDGDDELEAMVSKMEDEKAGEEAVMSQYDLNEAKKKEAKAELHPNKIHPQELRMGIKVELEHTDVLDKAKKIALDHLAENPFYYTALKLAGVESPSAPKVKAPKEVKAKKKSDKIELVDLVNGMKKVKMPKADEKKKLKEARFNVIGEPNEVAKQVMQFIDGNATLKALSDDLEIQQTSDPNEALLRFQYWDALPSEAIEKLKLQFKVESDSDFDEDTGNIIFYRLTPLRRNYGGKDLGASFEKFKSSLEEIVREVLSEMQSDDQEIDDMAMAMDEYFDGRDNLDAKNEE